MMYRKKCSGERGAALALPRSMRARCLAFVLGSMLVGCPDNEDPYVPPPGSCSAMQPRAESHACKDIVGRGASVQPGAVATVPLTIKLSPEYTEPLAGFEVKIKAYVGQALPGAPLALRLGDRLLQEAVLTGAHGNETTFEVELERALCASSCELRLTLSGPPVDADVPIPIELAGTVVAVFRSRPASGTNLGYSAFYVEVGNVR